MKFVCENCKAKYQIGDDKVAGKTLRMKCRKCGHMIQVSATVTESSVSQQMPGAGRAELHVEPAPGPGAPRVTPSLNDAPSLNDDRLDDDGATVVRPSPLFLRTTGMEMPAASPPRPSAGAPPRPNIGLGTQRPPAPAPPRPSGAGAGAIAARPTPSPPAARSYAPPAGGTAAGLGSAGLGGGFASALSRPVTAPPPAMTPQAPPAEDWYVGVGGVPLGPVRLNVIREKASAGAVDGESLVWREGFDEWVPLKTLPALLAIVDEVKAHPLKPTPLPGIVAAVPRNGSLRPSQPPVAAGSFTPNGSIATFDARAGGGSGPLAGTNGNTNHGAGPGVVAVEPFKPFAPLTPTPAPVAADPFKPAGPTGSGTAGVAAVGVLADPFGTTKPAAAGGAVAAVPFGVESASTGPTSVAGTPYRETVASVPPPKKERKVHPMAWAFIAMCAAFGGVAAWAIFLHKPDTTGVVGTATPTGQGTGPLLGAAPPPPGTVSDAQVAAASGTATAGPGTTPGGNHGPIATNPSGGSTSPGTAKTSEPGAPIDRSGFGGTNTSGPSSTGATDSGHGQLSEGEISGVVNRSKPGISRRCWDPAYDQSDGKVKSAKVTANVTIGPSGSVQSVSTSGGDAFPGLASCVAGSIHGWQFPPSDGPTQTVIPFGFNHQ